MLEKIDTPIKDCFLLKPSVFYDHRGEFIESYNKKRFEEVTGKEVDFIQDNQSVSTRGVLRGLHFQRGQYAQSKLVRCAYGEILDVVVDLRTDSPSYLKHFKVVLSADNLLQLFVPAGCAHGFVTNSEVSVFSYKCDQYYHKESEGGVHYNDPQLGIDWGFPQDQLVVSKKDSVLPTLKALGL